MHRDSKFPQELIYWRFNRLARKCFNAVATKPVIAAVNGPALGADLGLAASCDIIKCSDNAQLGMPEIDVRLAWVLRTLFGRPCGQRIFHTGWWMPAYELYRTGVVLYVAGAADATCGRHCFQRPNRGTLREAVDEPHDEHASA